MRVMCGDGTRAERDQPLPVPFPGENRRPLLEVEAAEVETDRFGHPGPGAVEKLEQRPVTATAGGAGIGSLDQAMASVDRERLGKRVRRRRVDRAAGSGRLCSSPSQTRKRWRPRTAASLRATLAGARSPPVELGDEAIEVGGGRDRPRRGTRGTGSGRVGRRRGCWGTGLARR